MKYSDKEVGAQDNSCQEHPTADIIALGIAAPGYAWGCKECLKITHYLPVLSIDFGYNTQKNHKKQVFTRNS